MAPGSAGESPSSLGPGDGDHARRALVEGVRQAILERLLDDLRRDRAMGSGATGYTKSDAGVYGKYEKQDAVDDQVLATIRSVLEDVITQYQSGVIEGDRRPSDDDDARH